MILAVGIGDLMDQTIIGLVNGCIYALFALGLVLIYRSSGIFNFAQGEFGTIAVYGTYFAFENFGLPYVPSLIFGVACGILAALATERFVIRPLADSPKVTLLVATTGVALLALGVEAWRTSSSPLKFLDRLTQYEGVTLGEVVLTGQRLLTIVLLIVAVIAISAFLRSPYGLAVLASSQDAEAAELVGVNVKRVSMMVWGIAGTLGALGGVLLQGGNSFTPFVITLSALIPAFTAAVIGGLTSLPGAVVGGMIIGLLEAYGTLSTFNFLPGASSVTVFVVLLGVLLVKPEGLLGGRSA